MEQELVLSRDDLRAALVGQRHEPKRETITLFGSKIDLVQPSLRDVMEDEQSNETSTAKRNAAMLIRYACVVGTTEHVFEDTDMDVIVEWPWGEDLIEVQNAIARLSGIDIEDAEQEIKASPLDKQSSSTDSQ